VQRDIEMSTVIGSLPQVSDVVLFFISEENCARTRSVHYAH